MEHQIAQLNDAKIKVTVTLSREELQGYVQDTEQRLAGQVKIDGFRQGKVPPDVLRKKIGTEQIREEALTYAIETSLQKLVGEQNFDVMASEALSVVENSPERLQYEVTLSLFPTVHLGPYTGIDFKIPTAEVSDSEIDKVIQDLVRSRTVFKEVTRAAQVRDRVEVDFVIKDGEQVIEGGESSNHPITLGDGKFVIGFEDNIIGMSLGEHKNFQLTIPKDYYQQSIAGKTLEASVTLKKIEESSAPVIDDEFVKSLGAFQSVEALRSNIQQGLLIEKSEREKEKARIDLIQRIAEKSEIEVPARLVDQRLDSMITSFDQELHQNGLDLPLYLAHIKKTQDDLRKEWRDQALSQVRGNLVLRAIAHTEKIEVTDEEVDGQLEQALQYSMMRLGQSPENISPADLDAMRRRVQDTLLSEKVFSFLETKNIS